ncbi:secretory phospholipase A2 receptor [Haplochromis burtoni]|uniref:secretory phospholipase A2 receptor n=1 Tax=Haplochromis burtoni TaxID=8153 RepID=UPI0003BCDED9|nr:secretory phospholipase A2 receptor [Haplochromis burtoni]
MKQLTLVLETHLILLAGMCFLPLYPYQIQNFLFYSPKTWYEAQSYCREKCIDLLTFDNMKQIETIVNFLENKYNDAVWFGLWKGKTQRWHWSMPSNDFYNYLPWGSNTNYNCGTYENRSLSSDPCHYAKNFICFDGKKKGAEQYILSSATMGWSEAQNYCRTNHTDLTSVRNDAEHQIIQSLANGMDVWIGLFKDPWEWSDQSNSSLRYWPVEQKIWTEETEHCGALLKNESGKWGQLPCSNKYPFLCVCKVKETTVKVIKLRISLQDSGLDLNNPTIQENILKQLMASTGANINLKWRKQSSGKIFIKEIP